MSDKKTNVIAVCINSSHTFSKTKQKEIKLIKMMYHVMMNSAYVEALDDKIYKVTIISKRKDVCTIKFKDGSLQKCKKHYLYSEINETPARFENVRRKLGKKKVDFGLYKNKNISYNELLKLNNEYCRLIVKRNYNIPISFSELSPRLHSGIESP